MNSKLLIYTRRRTFLKGYCFQCFNQFRRLPEFLLEIVKFLCQLLFFLLLNQNNKILFTQFNSSYVQLERINYCISISSLFVSNKSINIFRLQCLTNLSCFFCDFFDRLFGRNFVLQIFENSVQLGQAFVLLLVLRVGLSQSETKSFKKSKSENEYSSQH